MVINKNYLPRGFAKTASSKLRKDGYRGVSPHNIYYTATTGQGHNRTPILRVLAGMAVNYYQQINKSQV